MNFLDTLLLTLPALAVGLVILVTHIPLGQEVIKRGIIFIDLAIAQAAGFGLIIAEHLHLHHGIEEQILAVAMALFTALLFRQTEKRLGEYQEAIIGIFYVLYACLSLMLLAHSPHGAEHFNEILSGEMLFVTWEDILYHLPIYIGVLLFWFNYTGARQGLVFYILFALAITSSVQLVGVFLVFTSLIVPALALAISKRGLFFGYAVSAIALIIGMLVSIYSDLPSSICVILSLVIVNLLVVIQTKSR